MTKKELNKKENDGSRKEETNSIIERQLRFQDLLISISTKYINSDLSNIDELVGKSLKQIGEFVEADRSYVFSYDFVNNTTSNTYEWCANGIEPEIENLQNIPIDYITHWLEAHRKGEAFYVEDVSQLPKDGEFGLRAILEPQGIQSLIVIPKIKNNELIGFIGFDSVRKINKYAENEKDILFVFANMLVNVIQRKEQEELIKKQEQKKEELLQNLSAQNEELSKYAHAVSHDLKAPLINIQTLIDWFLEDNRDNVPNDFLELLKETSFNVEKMNFLIKGILDYSTIDRLDTDDRDIEFNVMVSDIVNGISKPDHVKLTIQKDLPTIHGNLWRFEQIFINLIENAIKYSDKEEGLIEVGVTDKNEYYEFFVKDNGIGINPDYFDRIFKVFTKLESVSSSSGIGLSIVKKIINYYKGDIWLESQEGKGTTFYFTILK
ncbi:GHKL domain-containing protein [Polaribacter vadi]|uniref:sensor histidine kinase n=1 Tax=Polaribacter TaxID=52959 RepID=UPI001C0865AF|nr:MULTISPECIES: ATP-binding protein [Polaribacter]MBU3010628.1 GHKL domain-containing protein [Polaribacter vadi]MDO6740439.1 ATP-binding protein [Polaribacter sp. 1_MG-2023]